MMIWNGKDEMRNESRNRHTRELTQKKNINDNNGIQNNNCWIKRKINSHLYTCTTNIRRNYL